MRSRFLFSFLVFSFLFPIAVFAGNNVSLISVETHGNLHAAGVVATLAGDDNRNASAELRWRLVGGASFRTGHPLSRIDATHFVGSLFWLEPGTSYEVQVVLSDPDGVSGSPSPMTSLQTRSENLPDPSIRTLYVATSGNDTNPGTNPSAPLRTIQRAANLSQPGDLILIQPGVYRESVNVPRSGTASQPIVFQGSGDGVILDGADATIAAGVTWTSVGSGVYSLVTGFPTDHVVTEAGRLYRYGSLADLQALGAGAPGGFYFDGNQLYVKFADSSSPAAHTMQVARLEDGLVLDGLSYVRIEKLEIRNYGSGGYGKGMYLRYASDIVVRDCKIHEIERAGIWIKGGDRHRIENNEFWDTSIFTWPWSYSKGSTAENCGIRFTDYAGRGHVMRRNIIHGTFNGIGIDSDAAPASGVTNEIDVYENFIYEQMDDAFEPEGSYTSNFRFWSNYIEDVHMAFSLAPVGIGPVWLIYNVAYRQGNTPSTLTDATFLKINNGYATPNGPIFLYHNTVFTDIPNTDAIRIMEPAQSPFITLRNNILAGTKYVLEIDNTVPAGSVGLDMNGDDLYTTSTTTFIKWFNNVKYANVAAFRTGTGEEFQGLSVEPGFVNPAGGDLQLAPGSALIDAGVVIPGINDFYVGAGPDIGAYEYGPGDDTVPPMVPTGLTASAVSSTQINLSWTASTDNVGVTGYRIYRAGSEIATTSGTSYQNTGLAPSTPYTYRVAAYDAAGNLSAQSSPASATTPAAPDTQAPTIPTNLTATAVSSTQINLSWTASTDNVGVTGYKIYRGGSEIATTSGTSYQNTGLSPSTPYTYRVAAYDAAGNASAQSSAASATTPAAPAGWDGYGYRRPITIDNANLGSGCTGDLPNFPVLVSLSGAWLKTTGNGGHVYNSDGYDIVFKASDGVTELDHEVEKYDGSTGTLVAWVRVPTLSYTTDTAIYIYYGNSGISTDQSNPTGVWDSNFVAVWHLKEDPSGGVPQTKNSKSGSYQGTSYGSMTTGDQVAGKIGGSLDLDGTDDRIQVGSIVGNSSAFTVSLWFKTSSTANQKIWAEGYTPSNNNPLTYLSVNENSVGDVEFGIRNNSGSSGSIAYSGSYNNNTWHYLAGVQSAKNARGLFVDGVSRGTRVMDIGTVTLNTGNIGAINRETIHSFFRGGVDEVRISSSARSACWIGTEYSNQNSPSTFSSLGSEELPSTEDTEAPTVPTNLTATAVSSTQVNLSWTASTDNVGVTGYRIYRGGSEIATTTGTSYQNTGLSPSTPYTYRVAAYDAAGNASAQSSQASATTPAAPDTQAPTVPTNLTATAVSSTQINLSWTASTDNVGVTGYRIYRGGSEIATTTGTSYQNTGLSPSTGYTYAVAAYDAAGNLSAQSSQTSATTPAAPDTQAPTVPTGLTATVISSTEIDLTWNASSDNVGVAGYKIYQNGTQIGTTTDTFYQSTGLKASASYSYRVAAFDGTGNTSAKSTTVTRKTQPAPSTKFTVGDRVRTTDKVSVRSEPSNSGTVLGTQPKAAQGGVMGGPWYWNNSWWWQVNFDNGTDGWVAQGKLLKVS